MVDKAASGELNFTQACEYLSLSPDELVVLREQGLVAYLEADGRQIYPRTGLELTRHLLRIGNERRWEVATLTWYADLLFTSEIGRAVLLPIRAEQLGVETRWLASPYANAVLDTLRNKPEQADTAVVTPLRSLISMAVGDIGINIVGCF